jgi:hypothetical protein
MSDIAQILPSTSCGDLISLRALRFLEVRYYCETKARAAGAYSLDCSTFPAAIWGRWQVLIYLFRDERTDNRALTMNVTGRNLPPVTSSTVWPFVEAINTHQLPPRWDTAYLRHAVRQVGITGFHLFEPGWERPPPPQTC